MLMHWAISIIPRGPNVSAASGERAMPKETVNKTQDALATAGFYDCSLPPHRMAKKKAKQLFL
jgi:hypothetical protein